MRLKVVSSMYTTSTHKWHPDCLWMPLHLATVLRLLRLEFVIRWTVKHMTAHTVLVIYSSKVIRYIGTIQHTLTVSTNTQSLLQIYSCAINTDCLYSVRLPNQTTEGRFRLLLSSSLFLPLLRSKCAGEDSTIALICWSLSKLYRETWKQTGSVFIKRLGIPAESLNWLKTLLPPFTN